MTCPVRLVVVIEVVVDDLRWRGRLLAPLLLLQLVVEPPLLLAERGEGVVHHVQLVGAAAAVHVVEALVGPEGAQGRGRARDVDVVLVVGRRVARRVARRRVGRRLALLQGVLLGLGVLVRRGVARRPGPGLLLWLGRRWWRSSDDVGGRRPVLCGTGGGGGGGVVEGGGAVVCLGTCWGRIRMGR